MDGLFTCQTIIPIRTFSCSTRVSTQRVLAPAVQPPVRLVVHEEVPVLVSQVAPDGQLLWVSGILPHTFLAQHTHVDLNKRRLESISYRLFMIGSPVDL